MRITGNREIQPKLGFDQFNKFEGNLNLEYLTTTTTTIPLATELTV